MGIFKESLKHAYLPNYSRQQQMQYEQQMADQRAAEQDQQRRDYLNRLYGSAGVPATDMSDEFSQQYLQDGGTALPAAIEGRGYAGSDRSADAQMQFAMGLLSAPESATQARQLGAQLMNQYMQPEKPQSLPSAIQEYQFGQQQGFEGSFQDWKQANRAPGVTVNTGGGGRKRLSRTDATGIIDKDGNHPPFGSYEDELDPNVWRFATPDGQKTVRAQNEGAEMLGQMDEMLFGEGGIAHDQSGSGPIGVLTNKARSEIQGFTQSDSRYPVYNSWRDSMSALIAKKVFGQTGDLTEGERDAAMALVPSTTDTPEVMRRKAEHLHRLLEGGAQQGGGEMPPPPPGYRIVQ